MVPVLYKTAWQSHLDTYRRYESMYSQKHTFTGMLFHKAPTNPNTQQKVKDKPIVAYLYNPILFSNKNKILIYTKTQMNLKNILLSKSRQTQKIILYDSTYMKFQAKTNVK